MRYFITNIMYFSEKGKKLGEAETAIESSKYPSRKKIEKNLRNNVEITFAGIVIRNIIELSKEDYESFNS